MKKILTVLAVLILLIVAIGFFTPTEYASAKNIKINAPAAAVHEYVGELSKWPEWAPWHEKDPTLVTTFSDQTTGVGAHQTWTGEEGDGKRFLTTSALGYKQVEGGTEVTWTMNGDWKDAMPPIMDGWMKILSPWMIGSMFDTGLEKLKAKIEAGKKRKTTRC